MVFGLDGADYDLVRELLAQGRLPTISRLSREGMFGPLRSTIPAVTPTAWSSFLTGLNPAGHGIFNFSSNPNRDVARVESASSRGGAPFWRRLGAAGVRSAFVTVPFTYPPEPIDGLIVTGYGGPEPPEIVPAQARERIRAAHPNLVTARHPFAERWWEDFQGYARRLVEHVDEIADVCRLALDLEPDLGLLCVDFMDADHAGHLGWHRLDPDHPAHDPDDAGEELIEVYEAVDRACGDLLDEAAARWGEEPTAIVLSDHGMKPIYWTFHANRWLEEQGWLRYRRRSLQALRGGRLALAAKVDQRLARTTRWYGRVLDGVPFAPEPPDDRRFADIDFGRTRAYCFGTGGQIYLGEATRAREDPRFEEELAAAVAQVLHPVDGTPAFEVKRKEELYRGPFLEKAPELVILPRDERIHVESSRRPWTSAFDRHERLDPRHFYGYSGHHGLRGILAGAGPGIAAGNLPDGIEITDLAGMILGLFGLEADGAETRPTGDGAAYSEDEERELVERLRDLGYE
jgi:predicted AlkP superfamily phosphohydrolase/phosphomutase